MHVQVAEGAAKSLVGFVIDFLIAEEHHLMLHQRIVDFRIGLIAQRFAQVDAEDFRADPLGHRAHIDQFVTHRHSP